LVVKTEPDAGSKEYTREDGETADTAPSARSTSVGAASSIEVISAPFMTQTFPLAITTLRVVKDEGGMVEFSWENPDPQEGDAYVWRNEYARQGHQCCQPLTLA